MKPKTTLLLAAVLVVLAGIAVLSQNARKRSFESAGGAIFPEFNSGKAEAISIEGKNKPVELRKQGNGWVVATEGSHEADPKAVKGILDAMDKFTTATLVSTTPEKQSSFQVDSTGIPVRIDQGGKAVAQFIVGKPGPDYMSTYVRPQGQNRVYQVPVYLRSLVDKGSETWRNQVMLDVTPSDVASYTTRNSKETVTLEKDASGTWKMTAPFEAPAKADVVSMVLGSLVPVRARGFADTTLTEPALGLAADTTDVVIKTTDGSSYKFTVGACNPQNQSYTRREGDPTVYLVPRGKWNTVFRPSSALRGDAEATAAATAPAPGSAPPLLGSTNGAPPAGTAPAQVEAKPVTAKTPAHKKGK
jgi:hypothetical protein